MICRLAYVDYSITLEIESYHQIRTKNDKITSVIIE